MPECITNLLGRKMKTLTTSGTYLVTISGQEYIAVVIGSAPMLQVARVLNLTKFIDTGELEISTEAKTVLTEKPCEFNFRQIDLNIISPMQEVVQIPKLPYTPKQYKKWLSLCGDLDIMLTNPSISYGEAQTIIDQLWRDKRNIVSQ